MYRNLVLAHIHRLQISSDLSHEVCVITPVIHCCVRSERLTDSVDDRQTEREERESAYAHLIIT